MKHLVYKTTNLVNGKYYIGVHSCKCNPCRYLGSGVALKSAIKKYGRENFFREVLEEFSDAQSAYNYERLIVNKDDKFSYNLTEGGKGGSNITGRRVSAHTRSLISKSLKGNTRAKNFKHSEETKRKVSQAQRGNKYSLGYIQSEETKLKRRISKGTSCYIRGKHYYSYRHASEVLGISHHTAKRWANDSREGTGS